MWSDLSEVCRPPLRLKHLAEVTATANNNTVTPRPPAIKSRYVWTSHYKAAWLQLASIICSPSASSDWTAGFLSLAITHHDSGLFCLVFNQAMEFKSSKQDLERPHRGREKEREKLQLMSCAGLVIGVISLQLSLLKKTLEQSWVG